MPAGATRHVQCFGVSPKTASSVGAEKPEPAIFHAAFKKLGAKPETTVFIGDSLRRDREGARRTGMRFIWMVPQGVQATENRAAELRDLVTILQTIKAAGALQAEIQTR